MTTDRSSPESCPVATRSTAATRRTFTDGLWFAHVTAADVAEAERLATTEARENSL